MERIYTFLPSILILVCIVGTTRLYVWLIIRQFGDNFNNFEWRDKNRCKVILTVSIPWGVLMCPALEELIFRAPLIIIFEKMSSLAWYAVFASGVIFWLTHLIWIPNKLFTRKNFNYKNIKLTIDPKLLREENKRFVRFVVIKLISSMPVAIPAGYYGIRYQSIWIAFGIHLVWNLITYLSLLIYLLVLKNYICPYVTKWYGNKKPY